jgi:hypothetical protein
MIDNGNRETWLQSATDHMRRHFADHGYCVPEVRVACGFPSRSATSRQRRRIGECWSPDNAADKRSQIFISPMLEAYDDVLATLAHELVHAVVGLQAKHGKVFKQCALAVGLTGKMTSTEASEALQATFATWLPDLGAYPHAGLSAMSRTKQSTRLIKCQCSECGYVVRTTAKWIEQAGTPLCPCNNEPMDAA